MGTTEDNNPEGLVDKLKRLRLVRDKVQSDIDDVTDRLAALAVDTAGGFHVGALVVVDESTQPARALILKNTSGENLGGETHW